MKNNLQLVITLLFFGNIVMLHAQKPYTAFQVNNLNFLYQGIENSIRVVSTQKFDSINVENANYSCDLKRIDTNNILINVIPTSTKKIIITLFSKQKILAKQIYKVEKLFETPSASIAGQYGKNIEFTKSQLLVTEGINVKFYDSPYDVKFDVISFSLYADLLNNEKITCKVNGSNFSEEVKKIFERVSSGSVLIFEDIKVKYPDNSLKMIDPLIIKIR